MALYVTFDDFTSPTYCPILDKYYPLQISVHDRFWFLVIGFGCITQKQSA